MSRKSAEELLVDMVLDPLAPNLKAGYLIEPIKETFLNIGRPRFKEAADDEAVKAIILELWNEGDYAENIVTIDDKLVDAACMNMTTRGELVRKFGLPSVEAALRAKGVAINKPGQPRVSQEKKTAKGANAEDTSNNPWSSKFRLSGGPPKSDADREARINAERAKFIVMAGAKAAERMAKACGRTLAGTPLRK